MKKKLSKYQKLFLDHTLASAMVKTYDKYLVGSYRERTLHTLEYIPGASSCINYSKILEVLLKRKFLIPSAYGRISQKELKIQIALGSMTTYGIIINPKLVRECRKAVRGCIENF